MPSLWEWSGLNGQGQAQEGVLLIPAMPGVWSVCSEWGVAAKNIEMNAITAVRRWAPIILRSADSLVDHGGIAPMTKKPIIGCRRSPGNRLARGLPELTRAICAAIVALYTTVYGHGRTTATTYINDNVVVCMLENIVSEHDRLPIHKGAFGEVVDGRVAFQSDSEDEFTTAVERLTRRRVVAFLTANQTDPCVACELFYLDAAPLAMGAGA
jgi:hypothetical protein